MDAKLATLIERLEKATAKLENTVSGGGGASGDSIQGPASGPALCAYDEVVSGAFAEFLAISKNIGGLVAEQATLVEKAVKFQRTLIGIALVSKKPEDKALSELIKPLQTEIAAIIAQKDKNRSSPLFSHLSMIADGIPALGWIVVSPTPGPYVNDMKEAAQFYANRVVKDFKEKDPSHVKWVHSFSVFLVELFQYVKKWHTTGLSWNPKGGDALSANVASSAPAPAVSTAGPPPPPAPTAAQLESISAKPAPPSTANLLGELSKGTTGLRKVDKSEMTHKNPELRATSVVPAAAAKAPVSSGRETAAPKGPPKVALEGNKWIVENQFNNPEIVIDQTEIKHVVYIYNCHKSTITINGKINALTIDGCKKVGLLVDNVVSTLDTVNSSRIQIQITGKCPTAVVDKTDGFQLYLSKDCMDLELLSAKSSEMNVLILNSAGEYSELPVSEQFKTSIKNGKLITEAVEHKE